MQQENRIKLTGYDDLFGIPNNPVLPVAANDGRQVVDMPLNLIHPFKNHPFKVNHDAKMDEIIDSIRHYGVLQPGIIRPDPDGGYENIAGHCRHEACSIIGLPTMPVIIKDLSDDEATVIMVHSNIQREDLLPSEKAFAYRMSMEAQKRLNKLNGNPTGKRSDQLLAEQSGEDRNKIQCYIRLTYLLPVLLDMVDNKKIGLTVGENISHLPEAAQKVLFDYMAANNIIPSSLQSEIIKKYEKTDTITTAALDLIFKKDTVLPKITLKPTILRNYFPQEYGKEEIENVIIQLLEDWHKKEALT